jgi:thymidylate synthase (FAD)
MTIRAYLIVRPNFDPEQFAKFLHDNQATWARTPGAKQAEEVVEAAGRICYLSFGDRQSPKTNREYIAHLIEMGHESVLEHVTWGFVLTGVSRSFSHQMVRHRPGWAFSQLSQQYHDENDATFISPSHLSASPVALAAWQNAIATARSAYREILSSLDKIESGKSAHEKKELRRAVYSAARSVLPNATETKLFASANARAIRHFLTVRGALLGDEEMRRVSAAILELVKVEAPSLFSDFAIETLPDGSPQVVKLARPHKA